MHDLVVVLLVFAFTLSMAVVGWLIRVNYRLAADNERLRHDGALLAIACDSARETFLRYARTHLDKNTPEGDKKANSNTDMANRLSRVLRDVGWMRELGPLQKVFAIPGRVPQDG